MIYVYKYLKGLQKSTQNLFILFDSMTHDHSVKLDKPGPIQDYFRVFLSLNNRPLEFFAL